MAHWSTDTTADVGAGVLRVALLSRHHWPRIASVGERLGASMLDLEIGGGEVCDKILRRVGEDGAVIAGLDLAADAERAAEIMFGPGGDIAPDFMIA
jgi:hypothetical protein